MNLHCDGGQMKYAFSLIITGMLNLMTLMNNFVDTAKEISATKQCQFKKCRGVFKPYIITSMQQSLYMADYFNVQIQSHWCHGPAST